MVPYIRLGAFVLAGTLVLSASSGIAQPAAAEAADWQCLPSVAGVPLDEQMVINAGSVGDHVIHCGYLKKTKKRFIGNIYVNLQWIDADSKAESWIDLAEWCSPPPSERELHTYPYLGEKLVRADWGAVAAAGEGKWDKKGRRAVKELAATVVDRAGSCGPDYSSATAAGLATAIEPAATAPATTTGTTTTTIVLSGGPGEEPPPLGATVPLPADDQHRIVIGGLDGEVIREEFLGDQATIIDYGPMATDADGNWSVSVEVETSTAPTPPPAPASPLPSAASPSALPSEVPSSVPAPSEAPSPPPTASPLPAPSATPNAVPPPEPAPTPAPALSPTPVPPPQMMGMPEAVAEYVAGLEPGAAGAVRDLTDYLGALGDELIGEGAGEVTIPASDLASLQLLAPGFVNEIRLVSGGIVVDSVVDVRVTPVIGQDGLIEFRTNRLQDRIRSHEIVRGLVLALNNYVVESGGRFRTISVTPEGLTVTAERAPPRE